MECAGRIMKRPPKQIIGKIITCPIRNKKQRKAKREIGRSGSRRKSDKNVCLENEMQENKRMEMNYNRSQKKHVIIYEAPKRSQP